MFGLAKENTPVVSKDHHITLSGPLRIFLHPQMRYSKLHRKPEELKLWPAYKGEHVSPVFPDPGCFI